MKTVFTLMLAAMVILAGLLNSREQRKITLTLDEITKCIAFIKSELTYRSADFESLYLNALKQNYRYIKLENGKISVDASVGKTYFQEFSTFVSAIGTTDEIGQLALCDEYSKRFYRYFEERQVKEKEKTQVNTAVSVLGAVCVLVLFL